MEAQLKSWDVQRREFAAQADKARGQVQVDLRFQVDDLKAKLALMQAKLDEFRAGSEKIESLKAGLEAAWKDFEANVKKLGKRLG